MEAAKFDLGPAQEDVLLASVDEGLGDLPGGYGESRIVLMPRDPQWAYAYWDVPNEHREELRRQGGQQLALRLYDVTNINLDNQIPHSVQEYPCDELAREWYLPIPVSDRDYVVEIGYRCADGRWLVLARSAPVHIPPTYPSDWVWDQFITVDWDMDLRGKTLFDLGHPWPAAANPVPFTKVFLPWPKGQKHSEWQVPCLALCTKFPAPSPSCRQWPLVPMFSRLGLGYGLCRRFQV